MISRYVLIVYTLIYIDKAAFIWRTRWWRWWKLVGVARLLLKGATLWNKAKCRDMTSYSSTSSDMNMHDACKQAGRWRSSEAARHEDTHRITQRQIPLLSHTHTHTHTHTPSSHPLNTLIALDVSSLSPRAHTLAYNPALRMPPSSSDIPLLQFAHVPVAGGDDTSRPGWTGPCAWGKTVLRIGLGWLMEFRVRQVWSHPACCPPCWGTIY